MEKQAKQEGAPDPDSRWRKAPTHRGRPKPSEEQAKQAGAPDPDSRRRKAPTHWGKTRPLEKLAIQAGAPDPDSHWRKAHGEGQNHWQSKQNKPAHRIAAGETVQRTGESRNQ